MKHSKTKTLAGLLIAAAVAVPTFALAQDRDDHRDNHHADQRHDDRHDDHGPAPAMHHDWHRGDHVPAQYRDNRYVVDDWRGHHLRQPPNGYHWVQVNGDFVLAAIATGVIADVLLSQ